MPPLRFYYSTSEDIAMKPEAEFMDVTGIKVLREFFS
jgi:hypothetical protein